MVNLPANVHEQVAFWILDNSLLDSELFKQEKIRISKWFLSNGSYTSVSLFLNSLGTYSGNLPHILVRNFGLGSDTKSDFEKLITDP